MMTKMARFINKKKNMQTFVIAQEAHFALATALAEHLHLPLYGLRTIRYADSEIQVRVKDNVEIQHGSHALVVHATSRSVHETLMELLFAVHMLKGKGVATVTAVIPYFGYARQDKATAGDSPAHFVMRLLQEAGVNRIVTVELHNPDIVHNAPLEVLHVKLDHAIAEYIKTQGVPAEWTIIAPDRGALDRVEHIAHELNAPTMVYDKERYAVNKTRITDSKGECVTLKGIVVDDIIDTGSTIMHVAQRLHDEHSACRMFAFGVHAVLSGNAVSELQNSLFERIWVTNTIPWQPSDLPSKCVVIDISEEIAHVVRALL